MLHQQLYITDVMDYLIDYKMVNKTNSDGVTRRHQIVVQNACDHEIGTYAVQDTDLLSGQRI